MQPVARKIHRRRSCNAPGISSASAAAAPSLSTASLSTPSLSTAIDTSITKEEAKTTSTAEKTSTSTSTIRTAAKDTTTTTAAAASTETSPTSSSSSSSGGHQFTLINKCSSAVKPVVVSTACGYSPRCSDASTAAPPSVGSLEAGQTTSITIADNFVGRIFAQNGKCGAKGEDCTMLEFNLADADSFYTPNSYDISNIQGFTQSISLGAAGCSTVTCTNPSCTCDNAYSIGDTTGCGNDLPVKACGKGNIAFTVVFCP
ncbi:hypothetical protein C8R44DRAFT_603999 [Mycena epipterygia]|nr:hypothetical protein C8R44DRAFT_603999 [Mycena epipterygia]